ncbi:MAG: hypothetical protein K2L54_05365 [Clostridiales bacterium]|nr:hypothetical protein [Clostridiales bacterium]
MKNQTKTVNELLSAAFDFDDTQSPSVCADETEADTLHFTTALEALKAAAPQGSTVRVIGFDRADVFLRAGYRVADGEADVTIARGGEREFDTARKTECKKLILAPTHAYAAADSPLYRTKDKAFAILRRGKKPFAAVFDPKDADKNLASLFGETVALDLAAFDLTFGAYMRGERIDERITTDVAKLVTETTSELKTHEKDRNKAAVILTRAGEKAARLVERTPELLHNSGAAQTAEALRMLYAAEDRPLGMRGETEMLLSAYVTEFYIKSLTTVKTEFPPDNNRRIDSVCEYFGTDVRRACVYAAAIFPPIKMRLYEYRREEFRTEQLRMLYDIKRRHSAAWQVFKRLYPDDGYGLKTLIDKTDLGICLALAPDVFAADTMLSFLKQTGRLEKYIV